MRPTRNKRRARKNKPAVVREVEAMISSLGLQGDGVAEINGAAVYVPYVLPGERVNLSVQGRKGRLLELIEPSPDRTVPACHHFGPETDECGGCALQHLGPAYYARFKQDVVQRALAHVGFDHVEILPTINSPVQSRRRAGFTLKKVAGNLLIGFHKRQSQQIIPVQECHVLHPAVFAAKDEIATVTRPFFDTRTELTLTAHVTLATNGIDLDLAGDLDEGTLTLTERETVVALLKDSNIIRLTINSAPFWQKQDVLAEFAGTRVALPPRGFLQATKEGEQALQEIVSNAVRGAFKITDLFSGCGTLTFAAAQHASVHAVEADATAGAAIARAHQGPAIKTVTAETRDLYRQPLMPPELKNFDVVIMDPPRAGAQAQAAQLAKSSVPLVVSISCNPKSFARDARALVDGGYTFETVRPVDQFLFSPHIELAGIFRREA